MKKLLIILIILMMSGCYNYKELNEIAIVSSIAIDKDEDKYLVSAQVMNAKQEKESENSQVIVFESKGNTINEALRNMIMKSSRRLYGSHLSKLVISEEVAKEGIINILDLFQRIPEVRSELTITIAKDIKAADVIKVMTFPETIPAEYVKTSIQSADLSSALTYSTKLDEFVSLYLKDYVDPVVSVVEVRNYKKKGTTTDNNTTTDPISEIVLENVAITNDSKLEDFLDKNETIGYNFIKDQVDEMIIPVKCDDTYYSSISVLKSSTDTKIKKDKNKYKININVHSKAVINEYNCSNDLIKEKNITDLEKKTEKKVKSYINKALKKQKEVKSKFLGLERKIYLDYPKYNNEEYEVDVKVNVELNRKGSVRNSGKGAKN